MDDKIFDFAYLMAFRDATLRKAFPKRENESDQTFQKRKDEAFENSKDPVRKYVEDIFNGNHPDPIPVFCSLCDDERHFTFGNAQKLVNMVAKYMYITTYNDENKRQLFKACHCPMDGIILEFINKKFPKKINVSWSKMEYKDDAVPAEYLKFQVRVNELADKEGMLPVEYDYMNW